MGLYTATRHALLYMVLIAFEVVYNGTNFLKIYGKVSTYADLSLFLRIGFIRMFLSSVMKTDDQMRSLQA